MRSVPAGVRSCLRSVGLAVIALGSCRGYAEDKLVGIRSARTMSHSMPWIAEDRAARTALTRCGLLSLAFGLE
jgi:hypothetical protein